LTTVLVVDEFCTGIPAAFCLSSKIDEDAMKIFFNCMKEKVGLISTTVFMSDDAPSYYNAWQKIMTAAKHHLLCNWHVDNSWRRNLTKIKGIEKRSYVYKTLRTLMQEPNEMEFKTMQDNFLNFLKEDADTKEFGEYFECYYASRFDKWAFFCRQRLGINTNMYSESFHKTLKYNYLNGKKTKRVDKLIHVLMKICRDNIFERLHRLVKKAPTGRIKRIWDSHKRSRDINKENLINIGENTWHVKSQESGQYYIVSEVTSELCKNQCQLICSECKICVHQFTCTCVDNFIRFNICKHIHACAQLASRSDSPKLAETDNGEIMDLVACASSSKNYQTPINRKAVLKRKLHLLLDKLEGDVDDSIVERIENNINTSLKLFDDNSNFSDKNPKEPGNKNIVPQIRFQSRKKKRIATNKISKPTPEEVSLIKSSFVTNGGVPHVHTGFDHTYAEI